MTRIGAKPADPREQREPGTTREWSHDIHTSPNCLSCPTPHPSLSSFPIYTGYTPRKSYLVSNKPESTSSERLSLVFRWSPGTTCALLFPYRPPPPPHVSRISDTGNRSGVEGVGVFDGNDTSGQESASWPEFIKRRFLSGDRKRLVGCRRNCQWESTGP